MVESRLMWQSLTYRERMRVGKERGAPCGSRGCERSPSPFTADCGTPYQPPARPASTRCAWWAALPGSQGCASGTNFMLDKPTSTLSASTLSQADTVPVDDQALLDAYSRAVIDVVD